MAETQTHPSEASKEDLAAAQIEQFDAEVTLDFSEETQHRAVSQREKTMTLFERIEADAKLRGFNDISGLDLMLDSGQRLKIIDSTTQPVYEAVERTRFVPPRIKGPLFKMKRNEEGKWRPDFSDAFELRTEKTMYKKTGLPRIVKRGSEVNFERREERINPEDKKFVTIETYDESGQLTGTKTERLSEFYMEAGSRMGNTAMWNWKSREARKAPDPAKELAIGLSRDGKSIFENVTEQLEKRGITNWAGLTWNLVLPSKPDKRGIDENKKGSDQSKAGIPVKERVQQIVHDKTVKERNYTGKGYRYSRNYIIQTTEVYADGSEVVRDGEPLKDYELWHYFEKPDDFNMPHKSEIWNIRMPDGDTHPAQHEPIAARGLNLNPAEFIQNRYGELEHDKRRPVLEEALGILSTRHAYPADDEGLQALNMRIAIMLEIEKERELGEELQRVLSEVGYNYFEAAVKKVYEAVYPTIEYDAARLGLSVKTLDREDDINWIVQDADDSDDWVVRGLLERSTKNRKANRHNPFVATLESPLFLRDLTDEHVGTMFARASVKSDEVPESDGFDEEGKPKVKKKTVYEFNEDLIETLPLLNGENGKSTYGVTSKVKNWRDKIWGRIDEQTHKIYDHIVEQESGDPLDAQPIDYKEAQKLGRMLRRTIGE